MSLENVYYASANSKNGFAGFFDRVFGDYDYRYIIKGGPGTGKSSFMKRLGAAAEQAGHTTEYILCSSDPSSLDGVIITDLGICMMDGTAPHVCDANLPGIDSEIINLGVYWNAKKLAPAAQEIRERCEQKSVLYSKVYHTLTAVAEMEGVIDECAAPAFDTQKATAFAARLAGHYTTETIGKEKIRLIDGYGMDGYSVLDSFRGELNYKIRPCAQNEYRLLGLIYQALRRKHLPMYVSYRALDAVTVNGIYLPEHGVSFTVGYAQQPNDKLINTERFIDKSTLNASKNKMRFAKKCKDELMSVCSEQFGEIKALHFAVEQCYINAMNFKKLTQDTDKLIDKILN